MYLKVFVTSYVVAYFIFSTAIKYFPRCIYTKYLDTIEVSECLVLSIIIKIITVKRPLHVQAICANLIAQIV